MPDREKRPPMKTELSRSFAKALQNVPGVIVEPRTGAYPRTADNAARPSGESIQVAIPGTLDLSHHPDIHTNDLPGRLDIGGNLVIEAARLHALQGKDINIARDLIVMCTKDTDGDRVKLEQEAWTIDGMSIGGDVVIKEKETASEPKEAAPEKKKEAEYTRLAAMTREQFSEYLASHLHDYAVLSNRPHYTEEQITDDELYDLIIMKPSRRGRPTHELGTSSFGVQLRAKHRYEQDLAALIELWDASHNPSESCINTASASWGRWIINGGFPTGRETTPKGYITLAQGTVDLTPKHLSDLVRAIQQTGVRCQVKIPTNGTRMIKQFDNIVLHAASPEDVHAILDATRRYCEENHIAIEAIERGEDGEGTSHSDRLVKRIRETWKRRDEVSL